MYKISENLQILLKNIIKSSDGFHINFTLKIRKYGPVLRKGPKGICLGLGLSSPHLYKMSNMGSTLGL